MSVTTALCPRVSSRGRSDRRPRLRHDVRGSASLEFALVAVPLIALLLATIETALIAFTQQAIETSAETSARGIMTGTVQSNHWTQKQFHDAACTTLPNYLSCSQLIVDVQKASTFASVNLSTPTITYDSTGSPITSYDVGGAGDIVIVRLMYKWPVSTGGFGLNLNTPGQSTRLLVGTNVAKTEPYA